MPNTKAGKRNRPYVVARPCACHRACATKAGNLVGRASTQEYHPVIPEDVRLACHKRRRSSRKVIVNHAGRSGYSQRGGGDKCRATRPEEAPKWWPAQVGIVPPRAIAAGSRPRPRFTAKNRGHRRVRGRPRGVHRPVGGSAQWDRACLCLHRASEPDRKERPHRDSGPRDRDGGPRDRRPWPCTRITFTCCHPGWTSASSTAS